MNDIYILGIESSCDETAAAVVKNGREVLSNVIASQVDLHTIYGGVVPEIASRKHIENINPVVREALKKAGKTFDDITAIAVTYGPGLVGALLVGVAQAKALAFALKKPCIGIHHIEGHVAANYIENKELEPPFLCLIVSGGHTQIVMVKDYTEYDIIGRTRDDAAGEAFDKVARSIGLGYPGGPKIDKKAKEGDPTAITFPKAKVEGSIYDFSFSGIKSAVLNYQNKKKEESEKSHLAEMEDLPSKTKTQIKEERRREKELKKNENKAKKLIKDIEVEIELLEKQIGGLDYMLCQEEVYTSPERTREVNQEKSDLEKRLSKLYEKWEQIVE